MSTNQEFLDYLENHESNGRSYSRKLPIAIKSAKGVIFTDVEGNEIIDCLSNAGTLALGHGHPIIKEEIQKFLDDDRPMQTLDLATEQKDRFMKALLATFRECPDKDDLRIQFCGPAGTDAVEAAIKLCKVATGRSSVVCFQGGYHGMTHGTMALLGNLGAKDQIPNLMPGVHHFPYPYMYRPPFGIGGEPELDAIIHYIEYVLNDPESGITKPACVVIEAIQGEGGHIPAPARFLQELRRICTELEIPLICDEIQSGFCRTGKFYSFEHAGIYPDVITVSKALGGGMPMAAVVYHKKLDTWGPGTHAGTFRGNQIGMATGARQIEFMLEEKLWESVDEKGEYLRAKLREVPSKCVGEVRGLGLMIGIELVNPKEKADKHGHYPFNGSLAAKVQHECITNGLMIEKGGRDGCVLRFLPPLIITKEEIDRAVKIFHDAILAVEKAEGY